MSANSWFHQWVFRIRIYWSDDAIRARALKAKRRAAAEGRALTQRRLRLERNLAGLRAKLDAAESAPP